MKTGILGTGAVGQALGKGFLSLGDQVMIGSRKAGGEAATGWVKQAGRGASEGTFADAARFGERIVMAVPGEKVADAIAAAGPENLGGKVILDITNPLDWSAGYAQLAIGGRDSAGETIQRLVPTAKVVKTLNVVNSGVMVRPSWAEGTPDMFLAGNDADAKAAVAGVLREFGWNPVDLGNIVSARWMEAICMAWCNIAIPQKRWNVAFTTIDLASTSGG